MQSNNPRFLFLLALAANLTMLSVCLLYGIAGILLIYPLLFLLHIGLFFLNNFAGKRLWQVLLLGLTHIAVTYCVHRQAAWLYFRYVADDAVGREIAWLGCIVGIVWTVLLLVASILWFSIRQRKQRQVTETASMA